MAIPLCHKASSVLLQHPHSPTNTHIFVCKSGFIPIKQGQTHFKFLRRQKLLKDLSTWAIGGPCNYFCQVFDHTQLVSALRFAFAFFLSVCLSLSTHFMQIWCWVWEYYDFVDTVMRIHCGSWSLGEAPIVCLMIWVLMAASFSTGSSSSSRRKPVFTRLEAVSGLTVWECNVPMRDSQGLSLLEEFLGLLVELHLWMLEQMGRWFLVLSTDLKYRIRPRLFECACDILCRFSQIKEHIWKVGE